MSLGFVFPGQGSQTVGMLGDMAEKYRVVRDTFNEAGEVLGLDMWHLVSEGPQERLNQTEITQPVLLTASTALWRAWQAGGGRTPEILARHSLGEYSALVCAGAMTFAEGVSLVHQRGKLMQEAVPAGEGAMAAILGLEDEAVAACCDGVEGIVSPANYNAPSQVVIAGTAEAVALAVDACSEAGAKKAVPLQVSGAFHSRLMESAAQGMALAASELAFRDATVPIVANSTALPITDGSAVRSELLEQLLNCVQWQKSVEYMIGQGVTTFIEIGPGQVLTGLIKRINRDVTAMSTEKKESQKGGAR